MGLTYIDGKVSDESNELKRVMTEERRQVHKSWIELAKKWGTITEDIILPDFPGILKWYFNTEAHTIIPGARCRRPQDGRTREFDIIAVDETRMFVSETKLRPSIESAQEFVAGYREVIEYFPIYKDKAIVPFFSALQIPDEVVKYLSAHSCYALAMGEEHLTILNFDDVAIE